ncbi:MAG: FecR domain-containing protein [Asticcacaulis sp.]
MTNSFSPEVIQSAAHWCERLTSGPMDDAEQRDLKAWLSVHPDHPAALAAALKVWESFDMDVFPSEIEVMRTEALVYFKKARARRTGWVANWGRPLSGVAAAVAIFILGAVSYGMLKAVEPEVYTTQPAERRIVALSDGSKMTLDASSEVEVRFTNKQRQLRLVQGRANFDVAQNPMRPFMVAVNDRSVVATGTEFSVEKLNSQLQVILYHGQVIVMAPEKRAPKTSANDTGSNIAGSGNYVEATLSPGQTYILASDVNRPQVSELEYSNKNEWQNGVLVFHNEPLVLAIERVNRYASDKVELAATELNLIQVSGTFKAGDTAAFLDGLVAVNGLRFRKTNEGYVIYK